MIIIGGLINAAVAWTCSLMPRPNTRSEFYTSHDDNEHATWFFTDGRYRGVHWLLVSNGPFADVGWDPRPELCPAWSMLAQQPPPLDDDLFPEVWRFWFEQSCGWPFRSMAGRIELADDLSSIVSTHWVMTPDSSDSFSFATSRLLPLRPIWPCFAMNTAAYGTLAWILLRGPFAVRRIIRRFRDRCPQCGYPIATASRCTECGRSVRPRTQPAT